MFVRGVVIHDQVQSQFRRRFAFDLPQEPQPFDMGVPGARSVQSLAQARSSVARSTEGKYS